MCYNSQEINNPVEIANTFNDHFSEIVIKITAKLPYHDITEVKLFLTYRISSSVFLEVVSENEIMNINNDFNIRIR